jgi:hypothetical protein
MVDKLSQGESLQQESNLKNIQEQTQEAICRIFFVRHGETKDSDKEKDDKILLNAN